MVQPERTGFGVRVCWLILGPIFEVYFHSYKKAYIKITSISDLAGEVEIRIINVIKSLINIW